MSSRRRDALIGLFVLGGLICLAILIVLFGESRGLFRDVNIVEARFSQGQLPVVRSGMDVNLAGVWVGSVADVTFIDPQNPSQGLKVVMEIDSKYIIPVGSVARVVQPLMGQSSINIIPPGDIEGPPTGTDIVRGEIVNPLETIIDPRVIANLEKTTIQIGELAEALTPAARAVTNLLEQRTIAEVESPEAEEKGWTANLYTAVERLHRVLLHIDTVLGDPETQSNVRLAMENLREASESAKLAAENFRTLGENAQETIAAATTTVENVNQTVTVTREHIGSLATRLGDSIDKLSRLLTLMAAAGENLTEGEGTAGMLLRDPKLYEELLLTVQRLGDAAQELQVLVKQWQKQGLLGAAQ